MIPKKYNTPKNTVSIDQYKNTRQNKKRFQKDCSYLICGRADIVNMN